MKNKIWRVIGVMSGTSLDGVDLIFVKIKRDNRYSFEILQTETVEYSEKWKNKLQDAFTFSGEELTKTDVDYGKFLSEIIQNFIVKKGIKKVDFIASHGHTIFHNPEENYTLQIGDGSVISAETGIKVICDFRKQDLALGGQGAPLVPVGDRLLFAEYDFCLNLGGFSNISFEKDGKRIAFDISPVNIVLNHFTRKIGLEYDDGGQMASTGRLNEQLFHALNNLPFYTDEKPKSLGYEFVVEVILPMIEKYKMPLEDILYTFIEHDAFQIARVLNLNKSKEQKNNLLITGGGAFNTHLISRIKHFTDVEVVIPEKKIIDYKEALIFALLGVLKDQEEINCLKSVTGASKDHSSGVVFKV
jgi:anhydro-N-acetylmuramic acid kinase